MDQAVDFKNLRTITGGDAALEKELFQSFFDSAAECISALRSACAVEDEIAWKKEAHAFKGICLNLGAGTLGAICHKAQDDWRTKSEEKTGLLQVMEQELARVRQAVEER